MTLTKLELESWAQILDPEDPCDVLEFLDAVEKDPVEATVAIATMSNEILQLRAALSALRMTGRIGLP